MGGSADDRAAIRAKRGGRGLHAGFGAGSGRNRGRAGHPALGRAAETWSLFDGGYTFASKIASAASEFSEPLPTGAYISAGFALFVLTFLVNAAARAIAGGRSTGESLNEHRGARPAGKAGGVSSAYAATADQKQRRDNVFLHLVRGRVDTVGLAALGGDCPGLVCRHPIGLVDPLLRGVLPEQFAGGVYHALYGTLVQAGVAAVLAVPLGLMTAVYLVEYGTGRMSRVTTFTVDVLAGVPSIVAALFVFSLWIATLGFQQSAFAVALALVLLMLPVVVRAGEEMLRLVPDELREASYALGVPKWKTIVRIVAPIAMPGIVSGILLSIARVVGETAPVLVLVGYSHSINLDVFHGNMASLPLLIYTELTNPEHAGFLRVWGAALTLIIVVATINLAAAMIRFVATRRR